jgi:hypothetical protein
MNDQSSTQNNLIEPKSWREERWERRQAHRAAIGKPGKGVELIAGVLLLLLGIFFLLQTSGYITISLQNWGAIFILIPVLAAFERAYREYRYAGSQLTPQVLGAALVGIALLLVTVVILFNLNWSIFGPLLITLVGLGLLSCVIFSNK